MRLIPGPTDVLRTATTLTQNATQAVEDIGDLVSLVGRGADLMTRAEALVTAAEASLARADGVLDRAEAELDRSRVVLDQAQGELARADAVLDGAAARLARGDAVLTDAETAVRRGSTLLDGLDRLSSEALPKAQRVAESIQPDEIRAAVTLIDRLPTLVGRIEANVLPTLERLDEVGPDVHRILESVSALSHAITGLPGIDRLQRRGERREDHDQG